MEERELTGLGDLYDNYLKRKGVKAMRPIFNTYSKIDGTLVSGFTSIPFEYKQRLGYNLQDHADAATYIEKPKYDHLRQARMLIDSPSCFYIVEYINGIFIFDVGNRELQFEYTELQKNDSTNRQPIPKQVAKLPLTSADFIISKKDWKDISRQALLDFLVKMKNA